MILIGIGANLPGADGSAPRATCAAALRELGALPGLRLAAASRWWESAPIPPLPGAPWFVNGVARLEGAALPSIGSAKRPEGSTLRSDGFKPRDAALPEWSNG